MLPPGFISYCLFNFVKKRSNKKHLTLKYFLLSGLCWGLLGLIGILLILSLSAPDAIQPNSKLFLLLFIPAVFFILGGLYALICYFLLIKKEIS